MASGQLTDRLTMVGGASKGIQGLPLAAKICLGPHYSQLLLLGDRLYAAWAGQADFEKLGVSCERSLTVTEPII